MRNKKLTEVYIYPYGGWHYHVKGCWMATTKMTEPTANYIAVQFTDINKYKTRMGGDYKPCDCVERYLKGLPLNPNPFITK